MEVREAVQVWRPRRGRELELLLGPQAGPTEELPSWWKRAVQGHASRVIQGLSHPTAPRVLHPPHPGPNRHTVLWTALPSPSPSCCAQGETEAGQGSWVGQGFNL